MDDLEAIYSLNKDKALGVLTTAGNLIIFTTITVISVFIPLAFTLAKDSPELMMLFKNLVNFSPLIFIPMLGYFLFKYREYKNLYRIALTKSIVQNYFQTSVRSGQTPDYETVCKEVVRITDFEYDEAMNLLLEIYPPLNATPIVTPIVTPTPTPTVAK